MGIILIVMAVAIVAVCIGIHFSHKQYMRKMGYLPERQPVRIDKVNISTTQHNVFTLPDVDHMNGLEFERFIADLLKRCGYQNVQVTKGSGDYGVDIIATLNGILWAFQCKCYQGKVGNSAVQQVYSGGRYYHAVQCVVVTNSYFTPQAQKMARGTGVLLWDRNILANMLRSAYQNLNVPIFHPSPPLKKAQDKQQCFQYVRGYKREQFPIHKVQKPVVMQKQEPIMMKPGGSKRHTSVIIGAGKYVFGEDIALGKYDLKAVSGDGTLTFQTGPQESETDWIDFGISEGYIKEYRNLSLPRGWFFSLEEDIQVEITKSKMIELE